MSKTEKYLLIGVAVLFAIQLLKPNSPVLGNSLLTTGL